MSNMLSEDYVRKIARLSRLELSDDEVQQYRERLSAVVTYVHRLQGLDLAGVEPLTHVGDATNRLAEDVPGPTLSNAALMSLAPRSDGPFVVVPKVLEEGGGA